MPLDTPSCITSPSPNSVSGLLSPPAAAGEPARIWWRYAAKAVQQQVAAKRAEFEEQKRQVLEQQRQVRELEMEQVVDQGQIESFCDVQVGDNLVQKLQVAVLVRDGVIEAIEGG